MGEVTQPHDHLVRALLSNPKKAGTVVRERLPKEIAELLSPDPLELVDGSFIDDALREHRTDRLFRAKTISGRTALIYTLIEHKSSPDRKISWQLLCYMVEALKQWEREQTKWELLPAIVPFVFYHGEAKWRVPNEFMALVDAEEGWRPYLLNFRYSVFDLGVVPDRQLSLEPQVRAWLLAAKYATRRGQQLEVKEFLIEVLFDALEDFPFIMRYVVETYGSYDEQDVREIIRRVRPEEEEKMMSQFAQDIIAKGKPEWLRQGERIGEERGEERGERKGETKLLMRQLQRRFGELSNETREKIAKADLPTLEEWSLRILDAKSLEDVFDDQNSGRIS